MPSTALQHFQEDVARARAIVTHANPLPVASAAQQALRGDLLRGSWMFAVGALDAYFCDAYTDIVAATIISKSRQPAIALPDFFLKIKFPVRAILEPYTANVNWKWRMAAREMMERENVTSLDKARDLFNRFFRKKHKLFDDVLEGWITHADAKKRLFGITRTAYLALATPQEKHDARDGEKNQLAERYGMIFQRRHDCIHNCDRPKVSPQPLALGGTVLKVIEDVEFLVNRCDEHVNGEFREFLVSIGCTGATINQAGY